VVRLPLRLVPVEQRRYLCRPLGERADERGELLDLTVRAEAVAVRGQRVAEVRIARHRGVPDAVDRVDRVAQGDRVQSAPPPGRAHPRIHL
jgi:hypothetical protein